MTVEQKRRDLFEAETLESVPGAAQCMHKTRSGAYRNPYMQARWEGFNAALDAVEIELPEAWVPVDEQERGWEMMGKFRAAIESTGLGIKVKP